MSEAVESLADLGARVNLPSIEPDEYRRLWQGQVVQYPERGEPTLTELDYFMGEVAHEGRIWKVDNLLCRGQDGRVIGILQFYAEGAPNGLEKPGNFNIWVHPDHQRQEVGTTLFAEAEKRWGPLKIAQQDYTPEGYAFMESILGFALRVGWGVGTRRLPDNEASENVRRSRGEKDTVTISVNGEIATVKGIPDGAADWSVGVLHGRFKDVKPKRTLKTLRRERPRFPEQMVDVRDELLEGWDFWQTSATAIGGGDDSERSNNHLTLMRSGLWWIGEEMCDLIFSTMPEIPNDVKVENLSLPSDFGLVFLEKPLRNAIDSATGEGCITIDAYTWATAMVGPSHVPSISITSYRYIDLGLMSAADIDLAAAHGLLDVLHDGMDKRLVKFGNRMEYIIVGGHWVPLGRSDWPLRDELDMVGLFADSEKSHFGATVEPEDRPGWMASSVEDRQFLATFATLLQAELMAKVEERKPSRQVVKHAQRRKERVPSPVKIVTLRRAKSPSKRGESDGEQHLSHRFPVRAHPRWQPCGPKRSQRKLIMVRGYVKGPEDAPFIPKETVNRWIR